MTTNRVTEEPGEAKVSRPVLQGGGGWQRPSPTQPYHIDAARMYEAATIRFKDSTCDRGTWWLWTLECAYHALMAGNVEHAHDVLDRYRPTRHYLEDGRIDAVYALWASLKASRAQFDAQGDVAGTRSVLAHLPTFAVQDMVIAAMCMNNHDAVHELVLPLCNERAGGIEDLIRACMRYAGVMCRNGAADVALKLVRATHGQLVLVDSRAFPSLRIALLFTQAKVAFERCDATGTIALCHETIEECARYQGETRTLADDNSGARGLVDKFLARATGSAGISVDAQLIAEMPAYARCMQAVCLFALQRQNDAYSYFNETLEMVEATDGIGSDIHLFVLDHYATCLISAQEYDRACPVLQQRLAGLYERRREKARVSGTVRMDVERAYYSDLGRAFYVDVERTYFSEVLLSAGDYAGAEQEARNLREELLSFEDAVSRGIYANHGIDARQRWVLTVEMWQAKFVRAMVQETMARALLWGGRDQEAVRVHGDTIDIVHAGVQDQMVDEQKLRRIEYAWDSACTRVADGLPPIRDPEAQLILPRRIFSDPALGCRAKMGVRYGASRVQGVLVYRRVLGRHYCLQGHRLYPF